MKTPLRASIALAIFVPLLAFAQSQTSPEKPSAPRQNTISTFRITPKFGHEDALKTALAAHVKKWHSGKWSWRVYEVISGPDGGAYHIVEGPNSWTDLEDRGDLGADHMQDFPTNILPHVKTISGESYLTYNQAASSVAAGEFSTKAAVTVYYPRPGRMGQLLAQFRQSKAAVEKNGVSIAVWVSYASGEPHVAVVRRYKNGWKDLDADIPSLRDGMESMYGNGAFDRWLEELERNVARSVSEMIEYKPDISSK